MTIGIIEDDTLLHQALKTALQNAGYQTVSAYTKREALTTITGSESLLLIDIGLPDGNGLACYKKIREKAEIPAIFLTARDEETDMLTAFDTGADDYVVKPFSMKVLLKRIEAVIGRNNREKQLACGEIILFPDKKQVYKNEKEIILTAREYQLLEYLMYNQGNVLTKENILEYVWGLVNYFNIMFTGIVGRKKELEIMRKIGMTRRQERKLLLLEGSYYVLLIAGLVVSVGSIVLKGIEVYMRKQLSYFTFHYPVGAIAGSIVILEILCVIICNLLILKKMKKQVK